MSAPFPDDELLQAMLDAFPAAGELSLHDARQILGAVIPLIEARAYERAFADVSDEIGAHLVRLMDPATLQISKEALEYGDDRVSIAIRNGIIRALAERGKGDGK